MALETSSLQEEIGRIMNDGAKPISAHWECRIETPDGEVIPIKLMSLDIQRKYTENFTDHTILSVILGFGTFTHLVYPYKNDLTVLMTRRPLSENGEVLEDVEISSRRYKAILLTDSSEALKNSVSTSGDKETGDRGNILDVQFQLLDEAVEQVRLMSAGGVYTNAVPGNVVRHIVTELSSTIEVSDEDAVYGVDMVPPDNQNVREHIVIPHGTKVYDLPAYVQDMAGGIYNAGLGFYLQNGRWYLYPELATNRFDQASKTLTVINVPPSRYSNIERTYRKTNNQTIILSTGDVSHLDASSIAQLNFGTGTRYTDPDRVLDGFGETKGNRTRLQRGKNNSEYQVNQREDGLVNAPVSSEGITANPYAQATRLARRQGSYLQLVWENSDPDAIYPGMPAKFMYLSEGEVVVYVGIVVGAQHYVYNSHKGLVVGTHRCNSALALFVTEETDL